MKTKERSMKDTMNKVAKKPVPKIKKAEKFWQEFGKDPPIPHNVNGRTQLQRK